MPGQELAAKPTMHAPSATNIPGYLTHDFIVDRIAGPPSGGKPLVELGSELSARFPTPASYVNSWFCDLHMGPEAVLSQETTLKRLEWQDPIIIHPGEFGVLLTEERVHIPDDLAGFISLRFSLSKRGLVNISGRHVDPRYDGRLVFTVYNAGPNPVPIRRGDPVFMITFATLTSAVGGRRDPHHSDLDSIPSDFLTSLHGPPLGLQELRDRMAKLESSLDTIKLIGIGLVTAAASATLAVVAWLLETKAI